jgi:hypothetical protein
MRRSTKEVTMAIRLRRIEGCLVALCAAETDAEPGDRYLDDEEHYALAAKFARDWRGRSIDWDCPDHDALAETAKRRDAVDELRKWLAANEADPRPSRNPLP